MTRWRAVAVSGALVLTLAGCTVEVVDDDAPTPAPTREKEPGRGSTPAGPATHEPPQDAGADAAGETADGTPGLPSRDDLRGLVAGQTACQGGDVNLDRAGTAVEIADGCSTLTVAGADSVVVATDVSHLVVTGAGSQVAVRSATSVTIDAAGVTVTWEDGTPAVTDDAAGSSYGVVGAP